ncbi:MAG: helix-turn-helix domain-containing protein [Burkholderiaceae bacterium]|nr:helix-turn-helix domain-containing protein [Aquabacterium sp.]NUP86468.1 helix-turn-helix domain-containing protein [Burkholderiaceae bacterium]
MDARESSEDFIDEVQLCDWLGLSLHWARKKRVVGGGPKFVKFGKFVRYRRADVQAWLDRNTFVSTTRRAEPAAA